MHRWIHRAVVLSALCAAVVGFAVPSASAAGSGATAYQNTVIDSAPASQPGGRRISASEVDWPNGTVLAGTPRISATTTRPSPTVDRRWISPARSTARTSKRPHWTPWATPTGISAGTTMPSRATSGSCACERRRAAPSSCPGASPRSATPIMRLATSRRPATSGSERSTSSTNSTIPVPNKYVPGCTMPASRYNRQRNRWRATTADHRLHRVSRVPLTNRVVPVAAGRGLGRGPFT